MSKKGKDNRLRYFFGENYNREDDESLFMDSLVTRIGEGCQEVPIDIQEAIKKKREYRNRDGKIIPKEHLRRENLGKLGAILGLLGIKRIKDYWDWLRVGMCLHNLNPDSFELWDNWSKRYDKKYDEYVCIMKWNTFKVGKLGLGTLIHMAKIDSPVRMGDIAKYFKDKAMFQNYKEIYREYLIEREDMLEEINKNNLADNEKVINGLVRWSKADGKKIFSIRSAYGTGKTTLIEKIINQFPFARILWVSYRQTYTSDIYGKFSKYGFKNYKHKDWEADRIICQVDSLTKLEGLDEVIPQYDLVILDEIESILNHYNSSTIKEKMYNFDFFKALLHNCGKILALDGDFYNRAYHFLSFFGEMDLIVNKCRPNRRNFIFSDHKEYFGLQMNWAIKNGENFVLISLSSKIAERYYAKFEKMGIKCCIHTAKTDDEHKIFLENVNDYWKHFQVVIYSPTVEAGVSFDEEHFHKIFCILSDNSTSPRGFLQMISRIRQIQCSDIYIYNNGLAFKKKAAFYTFSEVREYLNEISGRSRKREIYRDPKDGLFKYKADDAYDIMVAYNKQEELNKSRHCFIPYLLGLLEEKGHVYRYVPGISKKYKVDRSSKSVVKEVRVKRKGQAKKELFNAPDISNAEYDILLSRQYRDKASREDKLKIDKHNYKRHFGISGITEEFFDCFYGREGMLDNLAGLVDKWNIEGYNRYLATGEKDLEIKQQALRTDYINDTLRLLGFEGIFDRKKIGRDDFKAAIGKAIKEGLLFRNPTISRPLFGIGVNSGLLYFTPDDDDLIERFMRSINHIFIGWGFQLVMDRIQKKQKGKQYWVTSYRIELYKHIDDFLINRKRKGILHDDKRMVPEDTRYWTPIIREDDEDQLFED